MLKNNKRTFFKQCNVNALKVRVFTRINFGKEKKQPISQGCRVTLDYQTINCTAVSSTPSSVMINI